VQSQKFKLKSEGLYHSPETLTLAGLLIELFDLIVLNGRFVRYNGRLSFGLLDDRISRIAVEAR